MDIDPVGAIMAWVGAYGLVGLFVVALAERFVPMMPSYGLLLAIGISAASGTWSLLAAFLATTTGGLLGCAVWFYTIRRLGDERSARFIGRAGRLFGLSADSVDRGIASFRRNQTALAFALQLVPTMRLFAPAFAALLRGNSYRFLLASAVGISVWNGLFLFIGFSASQSVETTNTTVLALTALGCLLIAEAALFWMWRRIRSRSNPAARSCGICR